MIGVIIPVHNEQERLGACLHAVAQAARAPALVGEAVQVFVALDACTDGSARIARHWGAHAVALQARNVGAARAAAASMAIALGARWLSCTDADSEVAPDWIAAQLAEGTQAVCGTVEVADWSGESDAMRAAYQAGYVDAPGHLHVHGANLGVCVQAYVRAGGFAPLCTREDVALVQALQADGARIAWSDRPRVRTSARRSYRAPEGFGAHLEQLRRRLAPVWPCVEVAA